MPKSRRTEPIPGIKKRAEQIVGREPPKKCSTTVKVVRTEKLSIKKS